MEAIQHFRLFISKFPHYSDSVLEAALPYLKQRILNKGDHFIEQGKIAREIAFIHTGIFRMYYLKDGVEVTSCFCKENRFTTSYQSLVSQQPSQLSIQALEDAELLVMQYEDLKKLYEQHLFWQQIGRVVIEQEYIDTECHTRLVHDKTAKQRYLEVLENEPELLQRVSLTHLASYLKLTPETISRIRKQLSTS